MQNIFMHFQNTRKHASFYHIIIYRKAELTKKNVLNLSLYLHLNNERSKT